MSYLKYTFRTGKTARERREPVYESLMSQLVSKRTTLRRARSAIAQSMQLLAEDAYSPVQHRAILDVLRQAETEISNELGATDDEVSSKQYVKGWRDAMAQENPPAFGRSTKFERDGIAVTITAS